MARDDRYMDEILERKGFKELDAELQTHAVASLWDRVRLALESEIRLWNEKCDRIYDAAGTAGLRRTPAKLEQ